VSRVLHFRAFRQETFAPALTPAREGGAPAFGAHTRAKTVLAFACPLRGLESAFHEVRSALAGEERLH
jgi:hypothetical protein